MKITYPIVLAGVAFLAAPAVAQERPEATVERKFRFSAGPGIVVGPRSPGSSETRILPIPAIDIGYGRFFLNARDGLGASLIDDRAAQLRIGGGVKAQA